MCSGLGAGVGIVEVVTVVVVTVVVVTVVVVDVVVVVLLQLLYWTQKSKYSVLNIVLHFYLLTALCDIIGIAVEPLHVTVVTSIQINQGAAAKQYSKQNI